MPKTKDLKRVSRCVRRIRRAQRLSAIRDGVSWPGPGCECLSLCTTTARGEASERAASANRACAGARAGQRPSASAARGTSMKRPAMRRRLPPTRAPASGPCRARGRKIAQVARKERRRLPPVPLPVVALEPEQQVGSAVTAPGYPHAVVLHTCRRQSTTPR